MASPHHSTAALSHVSGNSNSNLNPARSAKSCESLYSNSSKGSANMVYKRKAPAVSDKRQPGIIPATNEVRQRVLSARRLRMKTYHNQLANAQQTIAELAHENRILRTLHKRQDSALSKYESTNAELPQLLHSHAEELRVWQTKYRNLQSAHKELEQKLKQKETIILSLSDQNKYYIQLNRDKNLDDRQKLTEKLQTLESRLTEKENDIKMMARKMQLESKQAKQQLQLEQKKTKEVLMKLEKARLELTGFRKLEEMQLQDKFNLSMKRAKPSIIADSKDIKEFEKNKPTFNPIDDDTIVEETEILHSNRSIRSNVTTTQRSTRNVKVSSSAETINLNSPGQLEKRPSKIPGPNSRPTALMRRVDHGDGDAVVKPSITQQNSSTILPSIETRKSENPSTEYEDDYENDEEYEVEEYQQSGIAKDYDDDEANDEEAKDVMGETGRFSNNIDGSMSKELLYEENTDFYKETTKVETPSSGKKIRMKEEISCIRKQISDDYKEREAFLDTFCRQATNSNLKDETPKKQRTSHAAERSVPGNRKHKLLAALKAIDDNKSQD